MEFRQRSVFDCERIVLESKHIFNVGFLKMSTKTDNDIHSLDSMAIQFVLLNHLNVVSSLSAVHCCAYYFERLISTCNLVYGFIRLIRIGGLNNTNYYVIPQAIRHFQSKASFAVRCSIIAYARALYQVFALILQLNDTHGRI